MHSNQLSWGMLYPPSLSLPSADVIFWEIPMHHHTRDKYSASCSFIIFLITVKRVVALCRIYSLADTAQNYNENGGVNAFFRCSGEPSSAKCLSQLGKHNYKAMTPTKEVQRESCYKETVHKQIQWKRRKPMPLTSSSNPTQTCPWGDRKSALLCNTADERGVQTFIHQNFMNHS